MRARGLKAVLGAATLIAGLATVVFTTPAVTAQTQAPAAAGVHEGVASCAGSTCHGRQEATGTAVRQNELMTWQDESSPSGAHSRAWRVLTEPRSQIIASRLGFGPAEKAPECLACHADPAPAGLRGERFDISEGVGCEACHSASSSWISSHTGVGVSHADNVARGMAALERPQVRASVCLDCHFGSDGNQFVTHRIMAAGHPRISFELELFTDLQRHHDEDADYRARKSVSDGVKFWAVGQSIAVTRALDLYASRGTDGAFPEFVFFDCRTCHRAFTDDPGFRSKAVANPGRPIPSGMPAFADENMLMLAAAAKVSAPGLAARFDRDSRAFHAAFAKDRSSAVAAGRALAATSRQLTGQFEANGFGKTETLAILDEVLGGAVAARYTDYQGGAQAVMAVDTLLGALVKSGSVDRARVDAIRPDIDRAYAAVRDANAWRPADFRAAITRIDAAVARLK